MKRIEDIVLAAESRHGQLSNRSQHSNEATDPSLQRDNEQQQAQPAEAVHC